MTDKKINLTALMVMKEIEDFLMASDNPAYHLIFSSLALRNKLLTGVLACIPNRYKQVKNLQDLTDKSLNCSHKPLEERLLIESVINQNISMILLESYEELNEQNIRQKILN
ncbi:MAG: hypothetical protein WBA77_18495 [Microcoleaceae cyanobacterium]